MVTSGERGTPIPVRQHAGDPEVAGVVTNDLFVCIDQAPPVSREHSPAGHGMKVSEWVDTITTGHLSTVSHVRAGARVTALPEDGRTATFFVASLGDSSAN